MKSVVIFEDGKGGRGSRATLVKRGNKRVLITFDMYCFDTDKDVTVTEWFKLWKPPWSRKHNKMRKHNNKRKHAMYIHENSNEFYSDRAQTPEFEAEFRKYRGEEYCNELFGEKR